MMKKLLLTVSCIWLAAVSFKAKAQTGESLHFDGVDDYVQVDSAITSVLDSLYGNAGLTVEAWVYPTTTANAGSIISDFSTGSDPGFHFLLRRDGDAYNFFTSDNGSISYISTDPGTVQLNTWQHICGTWDGATQTMNLYLNGALQATMHSGTYHLGPTTSPVWIGNNTMGHSFEGQIDEVRLWNRALCAAEVPFRMNCEIPGPAYGLLLNYHFNEGSAAQVNAGVDTLLNDAGNGSLYDGTLYNFALSGNASNWITPGAVTAGVSCGAFPSPFSVSVSATDAFCYDLTGSVTVTPSVGGNYAYSWTPNPYAGQGTVTMHGYAGTYTCTVTNECSAAATATAAITSPPRIGYIQSPVVAAGQSFSVGTNTYTVSGTYSDTLTSASGCDSIVVTELTVVRPEENTQSFVLCQGDSVAAGTHYYSATGNYADTLSAAAMGYQRLFSFSNNSTGSYAYPGLISDGTWLYGCTGNGGPGYTGTLFKIKENGTGFTLLHAFGGAGSPTGGKVFYDGTWLYGMTHDGGANGGGIIYKIKPDGSSYAVLYDFEETSGWYPGGSLISDGTWLYSTVEAGSTGDFGGLFRIGFDGTGFTMLTNLTAATGVNPSSTPVYDGTWLYGTTGEYWSTNKGTTFKIKPDGSNFTILHTFNGPDGRNPNELFYDGAALYGTTTVGGTSGYGTIYKLNTDGSGFAQLYNFDNTNGSYPQTEFISDGPTLYSVVARGSGGSFFSIKKDGSAYTVLVDLNAAGLGNPYSLVQHNGAFYGMTSMGGANNDGAIYKYRFIATDSIINTALTVNQPSTNTQSVTLCDGDGFWVGNNLHTEAGTYVDILVNAAGCDSIVTTQISTLVVNDSVIVSGSTLTAYQAGATYEWYDCQNGGPAVDTNQSYTLTSNGEFSVDITFNGCTVSSDCISILDVGLHSQSSRENQLSIVPNPNNGHFAIKGDEGTYYLLNELGQQVMMITLGTGNNHTAHIEKLNAGVYYLVGKNNTSRSKIVVTD